MVRAFNTEVEKCYPKGLGVEIKSFHGPGTANIFSKVVGLPEAMYTKEEEEDTSIIREKWDEKRYSS